MVLVPMVVENLYEKIDLKIRKKLSERKLKAIIRFSETMRKLGIDLRYKLFREVHEAFGGRLRTIVCGGSSLDADVIRGLDIYGIQVPGRIRHNRVLSGDILQQERQPTCGFCRSKGTG